MFLAATFLVLIFVKHSLAVCDNNIRFAHRSVKVNLYSLENDENIDVSMNVSELCEGVIKNFPNVLFMEIRGNLSNIEPGAIQDVPKMRYIGIQYHLFLTTIRKGVFDSIKSLERIDLSYNAISSIEEDAFSRMPILGRIYLDHNKIIHLNGNIFNGNTRLRMISVKSNEITQIEHNSFDDLKSVKFYGGPPLEISLEDNFIDSFDATSLDILDFPIRLHMKGNMMSACSNIVWHSKNGSYIDLQNNKIREFSDDLLYSLSSHDVDVYLSKNNLTCDYLKRAKKILDREARSTFYANLHNEECDPDQLY